MARRFPRSAVVNRGERATVQVIRDGKVETRNVRLGLLSDNSVEIREGISDGDIVVANAGTSLRDGDAVENHLRPTKLNRRRHDNWL